MKVPLTKIDVSLKMVSFVAALVPIIAYVLGGYMNYINFQSEARKSLAIIRYRIEENKSSIADLNDNVKDLWADTADTKRIAATAATEVDYYYIDTVQLKEVVEKYTKEIKEEYEKIHKELDQIRAYRAQ